MLTSKLNLNFIIAVLTFLYMIVSVLLEWFVDQVVAKLALRDPKYMIEEHSVEVYICPERLPDGVIDENVDIHLIQKFFSNDACITC